MVRVNGYEKFWMNWTRLKQERWKINFKKINLMKSTLSDMVIFIRPVGYHSWQSGDHYHPNPHWHRHLKCNPHQSLQSLKQMGRHQEFFWQKPEYIYHPTVALWKMGAFHTLSRILFHIHLPRKTLRFIVLFALWPNTTGQGNETSMRGGWYPRAS